MRPSFGVRFLTLTLVGVLLSAALPAAQQWPSFRGPQASGVAPAPASPPVAFDIPAGRNVAWRTAIPGLAHSSPVVWGDRIFLTTAVAASGDPVVATGDAGIDPASDMVPHTWRVLAVDRNSGKVLWDRAAHTGIPRLKRHVKASHASATPATNGEVVVALLGSEGLFCFDMNGDLRWRQDLGVMDVGLVDDPTYQWGPASSPVMHDGLVIVQNDRHAGSFLAAYDLDTGKEAWRVSRDELPSWSTPLLHRRGGRTELVTNSGKFIRGHDPATGKELWRFDDGATQVKVPAPVLAGDLIVVTGGYPVHGRPIYAFRPGLTGTADRSAALAWSVDRGSSYTTTPLVYDGLLYVCSDNGILSVFEAKSGERVYQHRISKSAAGFSASPIAADGRVYFTSEDGDVFVVRAGRTFELLATNPLGEVAMATPAITGDLLVVRTQHHLVGLRASARGVPQAEPHVHGGGGRH
jgi:outer membrane protein assembly factor BamB